MVKTSVRFGRVKFSVSVAAGVDRGEIDRFANEAIRCAADKARLEGRPLRALEALKALQRAISARWAGSEVKVEE